MAKLFSVSISSGGTFECSEVSPKVYLLSFSSPPDNRITTPFLSSFLLSLNILEYKYPKGVLIVTSAIPKFFSNGFDLDHVRSNPTFYQDALLPMLRRMLTYPMSTVALINGHTFGAGVFVALACDYRVQNPSKGFICLPEVDLGVTIPTSLAIMVQHKIPSSLVYREAALEGRRYGGPDALKAGLVDALGGLDEVLKIAGQRNWIAKAEMGAFGGLKEDANRVVLLAFEKHEENMEWRARVDRERDDAAEKISKQVQEWEGKSKL